MVFDGFCGTGMTGVAARLCGDRSEVLELGYQVKPDGTILHEKTDENGQKCWQKFSMIGARKAILNDLSPAATYISSSYNLPGNEQSFKSRIFRIIDQIEEKWGWMFETAHKNGRKENQLCDMVRCFHLFGMLSRCCSGYCC